DRKDGIADRREVVRRALRGADLVPFALGAEEQLVVRRIDLLGRPIVVADDRIDGGLRAHRLSGQAEQLVSVQLARRPIAINRPDVRNALSRDVNLRLQELAAELAHDDDTRTVVITGAGDKAFCAGADLKERRGVPAAETTSYINAIAGAISDWGELRKPTIA